ncbi:hypothetical protein ACAG96_04460 [Candidatus Izemoplasma sp. B36]|uniref:hypothetical protein n=1 Tax=Candidatus Izemoplasma sp. B36 TaxID=3242468 RepID=UPI00355894FD
MAVHEIEKNIKIIDEMTMYLFNKGFHKLGFELDYTSKKTVITITVKNTEKELVEVIKNEIFIERDQELEDYGWELLGECSGSREIMCVGMLVDDMQLIYKDSNTIVTFIRNH